MASMLPSSILGHVPTLHDCCSGMGHLEQESNASDWIKVQVYPQVEVL